MKYYTLKSGYALRGWSDLKYAVVNLDCKTLRNRFVRLTNAQFQALELIMAGVSPDEPILPSKLRMMVDEGVERGFLEECNQSQRAEEYQMYHYTEARYTHTLLWSVTGNCNLKCRHCYISSGDNCYGELSLEKCDEIIRQCREANVELVALTGGEPLVRKDFWELVDRILENNIRILQIFTNGMAVNEQFLNEFERRNINPNYFMVSFDGVNCHDWLRGIKGAEEKAVNAIRLFKSRGYSVLVSMALHDGNAGSLLETYALMKELGVDYWKASPIVDTGTWKKQTEKSVNYAFIFEKYLELIKEYKADNMPMRLGLGGFFQGYPEEMIYRIPFSQGCGNCGRDGETLCESTRYFPYLLPDGRVLPCIAMSGSEMEEIAPNILDEGQSLEKALSDSPIDTYTKYTYKELFERNPECAACEYRYKCSGCRANALACGGFFEKDPLACCFFKGGYEDMIKKIMA